MSNNNTKKQGKKAQNITIVKGLDLARAVTLKTMYDQDSIMVADGQGSEYRIKASEILKCLRVFDFSATESKKYTYLELVNQSDRKESIKNKTLKKENKEIELRFRTDDLIAFAGRMGVRLTEEQAEEVAQDIANGFGNQFDEFIIGIIREYADQNPTTRNESACELADHQSEIEVMSAFEDFLDEHDITIPSDERTGEEGEARLYGSVYYNLEAKVLDIIESEVSIDAKVNDIMTEFDGIIGSSGISIQALPSASEKLKKAIGRILEEH